MSKLSSDFPTEKTAALWGVDIRTISRWHHKWGDASVLDEQSLAAKLLADNRTSFQLRELARGRIAPDELQPIDAGLQAVDAIQDLPTLARRTEIHLAAVDAELSRCRRIGDKHSEAAQTKLYRELTASLVSIRRTQMILGQDAGDLIAKSAATQVVTAWASRATLGMQRIRDILAPRMLAAMTESEAVAIIDDVLISELFLAPFQSAITTASGCAIPEWFVRSIEKAVGDTISNGEQELKGGK